mgnify:CR=1 FL=1
MADKIMGKEWMAFTKITMDSYRGGTLVGQIKALADLQNHISGKIKARIQDSDFFGKNKIRIQDSGGGGVFSSP